MQARFIHAADIHLGNLQYQSRDRFNDFALAFLEILRDAITRRVDFVLIAGDVFHKRAIDAQTLFQAREIFKELRDAQIPALVIEGNHDKAYYRDENVSWLQFMSWSDDLILLSPPLADGKMQLIPWSPVSRVGAYYDVPGKGIRVYGVPWFGANTATIIDRFAQSLAAIRADEVAAGVCYRVVALHTGVEGMVPTLHGLPTRMQFDPLRGLVDYIALGHVHKPYMLDDWIYNPGSPETVSAEEWEWQDRGYFTVTIDLGATPTHRAEKVINPRRAFLRWSFDVEGSAEPTDLIERFEGFIARRRRDITEAGEKPVVDLALRGVLGFDQSVLDKKALDAIIRRHVQPLLVQIRNLTQSVDFIPGEGDIESGDRSSWAALEAIVFRDLVRRDTRFAADADRWAEVVATLKQHALNEDDPAAIATWLGEQRTRIEQSDTRERN